jgi:triphosphoribosyl-dephospho-CoA synthase
MSRVASLDLAAAETADSIAARSERGLAVPVWANAVAAMAEHSLLLELSTYPKPGLVSDIDSGSHTDMDAAIFRRSAAALRPFFRELVVAGAHNADMATLRRIGLRAEAKMLAATRGVNTHRGAIFGLGLLCAAAGLRASGHDAAGEPLGRVVAVRWGRDILEGPRLADSHGQRATRRYGAGGALEEAAHGFPGVYEVGLTSLRATPGNAEAARVQACFALIAVLEDTNLLHRGGVEGLRYAQQSAQRFLGAGGVQQREWRIRAQAVHHDFVERRLSPGGAADLLAMSLLVADLEAAGRPVMRHA